MHIFSFYPMLTIAVIFIVSAVFTSNPRDKDRLQELGSLCQTLAFLVCLIYAFKHYDAFSRYGDAYYELAYMIPLCIYGVVINLAVKVYVRFKFRKRD